MRATRIMDVAVCQDTEDDHSGWSSNDSADPDYPSARRGNVGQLWDKHRKFLAALPAHLEYGGGQSRIFNCPCSRGMPEWRRKINLEIPPLVKCGRQFTQISALMQHCNSKNGVYHWGFKEYVEEMPYI